MKVVDGALREVEPILKNDGQRDLTGYSSND